MFSRAAPVTSQAANQGETPECPSCLGKVPALPATMEFWGLSDAEGCLAGAGWGVALSGLQCILTLEFWLCYHVSLGPCCEGVLGKRESGGVWPQGTGLSTPPRQRTELIHLSLDRYLSESWVPGTRLCRGGSRGEDSLAQAAELPVWALLLAEGLGARAGIRVGGSGEAAGQRYIEH